MYYQNLIITIDHNKAGIYVCMLGCQSFDNCAHLAAHEQNPHSKTMLDMQLGGLGGCFTCLLEKQF